METAPLSEDDLPAFTSDKKQPQFSWRNSIPVLTAMQELAKTASGSQDTALIEFDTDEPITIIFVSDTHWGSWATDYELLLRITDEILATPRLYVGLIGDYEQMSTVLRSVAEVSDALMPPEMQYAFSEDWLREMAPRLLFGTWENHGVMREEKGAGRSVIKELLKRQIVYFDGIGHPDIRVGSQTYRLAVSHRFRGLSYLNTVHSQGRYRRENGKDRELIVQGDTHLPAIFKGAHGEDHVVYVNCGSLQTGSLYARRHFSLWTHAIYPCVVLHPDQHLITPYYSLVEWKQACGR